MSIKRRIQSEVYSKELLLSHYLEGYAEFVGGELSAVKSKQLDMLALENGMTLLEVGFGRGELLYHCAKRGAKVAGIDYSQGAFEIAQATLHEFPEADIRVADCKDLPFDSNSFERVFSGDVIEHLDFEDAVLMLKEMYRVLKPGSFMLLHTTPNTVFTKIIYPLAKHFLKIIDKENIKAIDSHLREMKKTHIDEYNLFSLKKVVRNAGLKDVEIWIDDDILRSSKHIYTKYYRKNSIIRFIGSCGKYAAVRFLLGNDLYLKCYKNFS